MKDLIYHNKIFFIPYFVLLLVGTFCLVHFTKADIHLFVNQYHCSFANIFFKYLTFMGDGIFLPVYLIILLMYRYRYAIYLVMVFLISGLIVQILKRAFFSDIVRPVEYFKNIADLYLVPGEKMNLWKSFPSGHSATAFGYAVCLIIIVKNNYLKLFLFLLGCSIAYSRMYLSQHFFIDILTGSFIGTITAIFCYLWVTKWKASWLDNNILKNKKEKINYTLYD